MYFGGFLTAGLLSYLLICPWFLEQCPEQNGNLVTVSSLEEMAQCMVDAYSHSLKKHKATEARMYLCSPQPESTWSPLGPSSIIPGESEATEL